MTLDIGLALPASPNRRRQHLLQEPLQLVPAKPHVDRHLCLFFTDNYYLGLGHLRAEVFSEVSMASKEMSKILQGLHVANDSRPRFRPFHRQGE